MGKFFDFLVEWGEKTAKSPYYAARINLAKKMYYVEIPVAVPAKSVKSAQSANKIEILKANT
jgi:hypothetical protein